jgi:hypothetical protein
MKPKSVILTGLALNGNQGVPADKVVDIIEGLCKEEFCHRFQHCRF